MARCLVEDDGSRVGVFEVDRIRRYWAAGPREVEAPIFDAVGVGGLKNEN